MARTAEAARAWYRQKTKSVVAQDEQLEVLHFRASLSLSPPSKLIEVQKRATNACSGGACPHSPESLSMDGPLC
jgi:hypothetical protein